MLSNKLALGFVAAVISVFALGVQAASAGQNHNHNHGVKIVIGNGNGHSHHNHHHHGHFHPQFRPIIIKPQVQVLYCVVVRQPNRYHDWDFHQVKCFHSEYEASLFASSLRSRFFDDHGFAVRVQRQAW